MHTIKLYKKNYFFTNFYLKKVLLTQFELIIINFSVNSSLNAFGISTNFLENLLLNTETYP